MSRAEDIGLSTGSSVLSTENVEKQPAEYLLENLLETVYRQLGCAKSMDADGLQEDARCGFNGDGIGRIERNGQPRVRCHHERDCVGNLGETWRLARTGAQLFHGVPSVRANFQREAIR